MPKKILIVFAALLLLTGCSKQKELKPAPRFHLDTRFEVQVKIEGNKDVVSRQTRNLNNAFDRLVELDSLLNKLSPLSEISALNTNAGVRMMEINKLTYDLIEKSLNASAFTDGYFDISWQPLIKLFESSQPSPERIARAKAASGYQNIILDAGLRRVRYLHNATQIDFENIKRGFSVDLLSNSLKGVTEGHIKAGNIVYYFGSRRVPIKYGDKQILSLKINNAAVTILNTTGTYYVNSVNWRKYLPVESPLEPIQQIIVVAPNAVTAEVLASAFYFMGVEQSLQKIREIKKQASHQNMYEVYFVLDIDGETQIVSGVDKN